MITMAISYESAGQQIGLTGSQTAPSFQPRQVAVTPFDPSRQMLQQSEQDLTAFSQFSNTLTSFLTDRAKERNESEKNLGIADIVNGRKAPSQQQLTTYNIDKTLLQTANSANQEVVASVGVTNPSLAEDLYQGAPAATGWRAYGQAIGIARKGASGLEAYMSDFLSRTDAIIPGPDGVLFAPARSRTRAQLEASWEVGITEYTKKAGLGNVNPMIVAAEVAPIAMRTRSEMLGMQMQQIITTREANEREDLRGSLSQQTSLMKDPAALSRVVFDMNDKLVGLNRGNRGKANTETNEMMVAYISTVNDSDSTLAKQLLKNYKATLLNPGSPELGTYGQRFNLKELSDLIVTTRNQADQDITDGYKEEAESIVQGFYNNRNPGNYREALRLLKGIPQTPDVRRLQQEFVDSGPDYDPQRADELGKAAATLAELEAIKKQGLISTEIFNRESNRFADEAAAKELLPSDAAIKGKAKDFLRQIGGAELGKVPEYFDSASGLAAESMANIAKQSVLAEIASGKIDKNSPNLGSLVSKRLEDLLLELAPGYISGKGKDAKILPASQNPNIKGAIVGPAAGTSASTNGRDLVNLVQSRVPRVTSAVKDTSIDPERWDLAMESLSAGGKPPSDVMFHAKAAGVSVPEFLRRQAIKLGRTYDAKAVESGNKVYQANKATSPRLAELIANPRTTSRMREQYQVELQRLRVQPTQPTPTGLQSLSGFKPQVSSIEFESPSGQPGLDVFFENKQFPAVLPGKVKDIRYDGGYGNLVVIESIDPDTGESVDVLYGHLASRTPLRIGQTVTVGQLVGTQGGTGNVRSADGTIASIDFLAPAPTGSSSMTPYRNFDKLRRRIARELKK